MYPGTIVVYEDQSQITNLEIAEVTNKPLYLNLFTSDKGPEDWRVVTGKEFFTLYGNNIDFSRHGQPLLQAAMSINWGAKLFCKRVVAENSALANLSVYATVYQKRVQKQNANGKKLYYDNNGNETIVVTNKPVMTTGVDVLYRSKSFDEDIDEKIIKKPIQVKKAFNAFIKDLNDDAEAEFESYVDSLNKPTGSVLATTDITVTAATFFAKVTKAGIYNFVYNTANTSWYIINADGSKTAVTLSDYGITIVGNVALVNNDTFRINCVSASSATVIIPNVVFTLGDEDEFAEGLGLESETVPGGRYVFTTSVSGSTVVWNLDGNVVDLDDFGCSATGAAAGDVVVVYKNMAPAYYPLFILCDIGRGVSNKRFSITSSNYLSKNASFAIYDFNVLENGSTVESINFALDPDKIYNGENISFKEAVRKNSKQLISEQDADEINKFLDIIAEYGDFSDTFIEENNILFGKLLSGKEIYNMHIFNVSDLSTTGFEIPEYITEAEIRESISLSYPIGHLLTNGSNGAFGDNPMHAVEAGYYTDENGNILTDESGNPLIYTDNSTGTTVSDLYIERFCQALNPRTDVEYDWNNPLDIYDYDRFMVDLVIDANYPQDIKRAIETLVNYREDCLYMRDIGTNITSLTGILNCDTYTKGANTKFMSTYCFSYDVYDPYSEKQITVTPGYSISRLMVDHWQRGANLPFAGIRFNATIPEAIEGTVSFIPKICPNDGYDPNYNQKETLCNARLNYASYYNNVLTLETLYTSNPTYSQFSFSNNILAIQQVVKAIRAKCPSIRYAFILNEDFESYKKEITSVLNNYSNNFMTLTMEYKSDKNYEINKIFYATIKVKFKDFIQTEYFRIIAINDVG